MNVHIEGMGVVGSALGWMLARAGVPFTWSDIDTRAGATLLQEAYHGNPHKAAWTSSTGAIYPSGNQRDRECYQVWRSWASAGAPWTRDLARTIETAAYWYVTKNAPHGGSDEPSLDLGHIRCHALPSYHLHVQRFVAGSRDAFAGKRVNDRAGAQPGARIVVAHGFNDRLQRVVWGWTRIVDLELDRRIYSGLEGAPRPCIYIRPNRYTLAYAYPLPGTPYWYAGSSLIVQKTARELSTEDKYARWHNELVQHTGGFARVREVKTPILQAWRPSLGTTADEAEEPLWSARADGSLVVMPLWHSGVRWLPAVLRAAAGALGLRS